MGSRMCLSAFKMIHEYFLLDSITRQTVRDSNNTIVERCDEVWVFGPVSDGVLEEIRLAKKCNKPISKKVTIYSEIFL